MKGTALRLTALLMALQISGLAGPLLAGAAMVETGEVLEREGRSAGTEKARLFLARQEVRETLLSLGVDPGDVDGRLADLTADEIQRLEAGLTTLPAGGDSVLAVIGVVFLVLLILEIVGVTDIFKKV